VRTSRVAFEIPYPKVTQPQDLLTPHPSRIELASVQSPKVER